MVGDRVPRRARDPNVITGRLRAADPFELIRWLARSQSDPRKALAELVQNSIDAGARNVRITRLREHGITAVHVLDDGEGVIPELDRTQALTYVATHIGHSRKRNLTPEQRRELLTQGKYGIGLLGFWAIGQVMEIRTQIPGEPPFLLRLFEDKADFQIERARAKLALGERSTEVVIRHLHRPAFFSLSARRIADYLASELRGQLLARDVDLRVHDRIARGRAPKVLQVRPARFDGERLAVAEEIPVPGYTPLRVELYLQPEGGRGGVALLAAGTIVYESVQDLDLADFRRPPWSDSRLIGIVDFSDLEVAPGNRRGAVPNAAALALVDALRALEPAILEELRRAEEVPDAAVGRDLVRQLEKVFRDLPRLAPEYDFFAIRGPIGLADAPASEERESVTDVAAAEASVAGEPVAAPGDATDDADEDAPSLLPPGPLASVDVVPAATRVERLGFRRLRATARDANGVAIPGVALLWTVPAGALGRLEPEEGRTVVFTAGPDPAAVTLRVEARESDRTATAEATIEIVDEIAGGAGARAGIPEPTLVDEPQAPWRSRMSAARWQVNSGHPDFRTALETPRRRLRYLASLLAKEIVLHSFPAPQLDAPLERLVGVLAIAERRFERS
jgi:hypothetical protein